MDIPVDLNTADWDREGRVWINTIRHPHLEGLLRPGMSIVLVDSDIEVSGEVEFDASHPIRTWLARPDWSTAHDRCLP